MRTAHVKRLAAAVMILFLALPAGAQEEELSPDAGGENQALSDAKFMIAKSRMLEQLKKTEACIQAAATPDDIRTCLPGAGASPGGTGAAPLGNKQTPIPPQ